MIVSFAVTGQEKQSLKAEAKKEGKTISGLVRSKLGLEAKGSDIAKQMMLSMPPGSPKPLSKALSNYVNRKGSSYDPEFDRKIRELHPEWFAVDRTVAALKAWDTRRAKNPNIGKEAAKRAWETRRRNEAKLAKKRSKAAFKAWNTRKDNSCPR